MAVWSKIQFSELHGRHRLDAEFYRPEYLQADKSVCRHKRLSEYQRKIIHPKEIKRVYADGDQGVGFLLTQNIQPGRLDFTTETFIPPQSARELRQNKLEVGDVLVTRTGANYGDCAPYLGEPELIYASAHCLVIRPKNISGPYLAVYLNTRIGRALVKRGVYGTSQPELAPDYLKCIPIPRFSDSAERDIERLVQEALEQDRKTRNLYAQAEKMVLDEVGFSRVDLSWTHGYTIASKEACATNRIDAEHFQPRYVRLIQHLERTGKAVSLDDIASRPHRGAQPSYAEGGHVFVVNSQHLGRHLVNVEGCERTDERDYDDNPKAHLRKDDVLIYATGAYVGRTNIWLENMKAMASNHVTIVRPKKDCDPRYLAVYLNSPLGMLQADCWATGSAQRELYPEEISKFTVHLPLPSFQEKIAELVTAAYEARAKAKKLLEDAKRKVEELISRT